MHSLSMGRLTNMSLAGLNLTHPTSSACIGGGNTSTQNYSTVQNKLNKTSSPSNCSSPTSRLNPPQRRFKSMGNLMNDHPGTAKNSQDSNPPRSRGFRLKKMFTKGFASTLDDSFAEGVFRGSSGGDYLKHLLIWLSEEKNRQRSIGGCFFHIC